MTPLTAKELGQMLIDGNSRISTVTYPATGGGIQVSVHIAPPAPPKSPGTLLAEKMVHSSGALSVSIDYGCEGYNFSCAMLNQPRAIESARLAIAAAVDAELAAVHERYRELREAARKCEVFASDHGRNALRQILDRLDAADAGRVGA